MTTPAKETRHPDRILFASCNSQHYDDELSKTLWPAILSRNASAFVWAGDAIYADDFYPPKTYLHWLFGKPSPKPATPPVIRGLYSKLTQSPGYSKILEENMTILGALDDHDYGCNNGDVTYQHKVKSNMAFVHFLQEKRWDTTDWTLMARRAAAGKGVYGVKVFDFSRPFRQSLVSDDEAGIDPEVERRQISTLSDRSVAVFLLDVRSNKTPWPSGRKKYFVDYDADFLGDEQWTWFEEAIKRSTATVNIIVQGLQVHADRYFDGNTVESWSRFPMAQHRIYQTILQSNVSAPILVSGDVHMAEILRKDCKKAGRFDLDDSRMLLEVTTSGMTHSWGTNICARPTSSMACQSSHMAFSLMAGMHLAHNNYAWTDLVYEPHPFEVGAKSGYQYALARNFGEFEMDWEQRRVIVRIFGQNGSPPLLSTSWNFDALSKEDHSHGPSKLHDYEFERLLEDAEKNGGGHDDWICLNYGGHPSLLLKAFGVLSPVLLAGTIMCLPLLLPALLACFLIRRGGRSKRS